VIKGYGYQTGLLNGMLYVMCVGCPWRDHVNVTRPSQTATSAHVRVFLDGGREVFFRPLACFTQWCSRETFLPGDD